MSLQEHAEDGRTTALAQGINSWPQLIAAVLFKFGVGVSGVIALVAVLGFVSWLLWGQQIQQAKEMASVQAEYISSIKQGSSEKSELVKSVITSQNDSANANRQLAEAVTELKDELRTRR